MAKCTVELKAVKTWWFHALKPIWFIQTILGDSRYLLIDKAFKFEVVK